MIKINFSKIEKKWQDRWEKKKVFEVNEDKKKQKFYVLEMFPYPSGAGLHMGHALNYSIGDIFARFKIMQGFNVLHPMGFDSLGLPAENAAVKAGEHPKKYTEKAIKNYIKQMKNLGLSYDWSRMVSSHEPEYYKWDQWIFLKMFEKGLAYKKESPVNWCPKCNSVLANEQVHDGKCWRHEDTNVEVKHLVQWYLKITDYAEELADFKELGEWPDLIKKLQKNWIGKSYGAEILFEVVPRGMTPEGALREKWPIFTTRPDTLFGVTFMVVSAQHSRLMELVTDDKKKDVEKFVKKLSSVSEEDIDKLDKVGVFTGSYAIHPLTKEKIPIYTGNFVLADYGSGMVMAVPAHDQRDFEFAKKYKIDVKVVIGGDKKLEKAYTDKGKLINSKEFDGIESDEAKKEITKLLKKKKLGGEVINYRLRDWLVSRQRYWGTPIPIINCEKCAIKETKTKITFDFHGSFRFNSIIERKKNIETRVLDKKERKDLHSGDLILLKHEDGREKIIKVVEADYFKDLSELYKKGKKLIKDIFPYEKISSFRDLENAYKKIEANYVERINKFGIGAWKIDLQNISKVVAVPEKDLPVELPDKVKFGKGNPLESAEKWKKVKCPKCGGDAKRETDTLDTFVNSSWYFWRYCDSQNNNKIFDLKKVDYWAPVDFYIGGKEHACMHLIYSRFYTKFLRDMGLLKIDEPAIKLFNQGMLHGEGGEKMSKSKGNIVLPETISKKYGIDTARLFLVSVASPDKDIDWSEKGINGSLKFVKKVFEYFNDVKIGKSSASSESKLNKTIKGVTEDIENLKYNLGVIKLRQLFENFKEKESKETLESFLKMLGIFCPHIAEELWEKLGNKGFISLSEWPKCDEKKINKKLEMAEQTVDNTVSDIMNILRIVGERKGSTEKVYVYVMPFELEFFDEVQIGKRVGKDVKIFSVQDKNKYDPKGIAKKSKPGKPGIFVE